MSHITHRQSHVQPPPVHRWLQFADSRHEHSVHRALAALGARPTDVIYDPFVGCGTTAVAAAARGHRTVSTDRSALAALATVIKLYPPDQHILDEVAETVRSAPCTILIRKCRRAGFRRGASSPVHRALIFVLVAGWLRARASCDPRDLANTDARWLGEALRVIDEIRVDQATNRSRVLDSKHVVRCQDFVPHVARLPGSAATPITMVTSPPLPVRHVDADRQRLDRLIHATVPRLRIFARHVHRTISLGAAERDRVDAYASFLDSILLHAQYLGCAGIAIEVSSRPMPQGIAWDELLVSRLPAFGFTLVDVHREVAGDTASSVMQQSEPLSTVCASAVDEG
jgi:hypothetical protein